MADKLFQPLKVGALTLSHRISMAPLTRFRVDENNVPLPFVKTYYEQRASIPGTFLITEATVISPRAGGYANVPGIWNRDQIKAWREVTDAVHAKGSYIFCQLWALGRVANPKILEAQGFDVVSSSAVALDSNHVAPHALNEEEIQSYILDYATAAQNAIEAGFDGVEVHGANGYLPDQFLQDVVNQRDDRWGGSIENRSRFHLEVTKAVIAAVGAARVGVRLSPFSEFQGMKMEDPVPQFTHVITELKKLDIAYLHLVESRIAGTSADGVYAHPGMLDFAFEIWGTEKPVFLAGGFTPEKAKDVTNNHYGKYQVVIAFGRYFISTPDLQFRVKLGMDLNPYHRETFYKPMVQEGYTDYPFSQEFLAVAS